MSSWSNRAANPRATWSRPESIPYPSPLGFREEWKYDLAAPGQALVTYDLDGKSYVVVASEGQVTALDPDRSRAGNIAEVLWSRNLSLVSDLIFNPTPGKEELLVFGHAPDWGVGTNLWVLDPRTGATVDQPVWLSEVTLARSVTLAGDYLVQLVASPLSVGPSARSIHGFVRRTGGPCYEEAWATNIAYDDFPLSQDSDTWQEWGDWTQVASGCSPVNGSVLVAHAQADPTEFQGPRTRRDYYRSRCGFLCLDPTNGTILWRKDFDSTYFALGNANGAFPGRSIPVDSKGNWYVDYQVCDELADRADSVLESFNPQGISRWKHTRSHATLSAGNWLNYNTSHQQLALVGDVYLLTRCGGAFGLADRFEWGVVCRRAADGTLLWAIEDPRGQGLGLSNVTATGEWALVPGNIGAGSLAAYHLVDVGTGTIESSLYPESGTTSTAAIDGKGRAYVFDPSYWRPSVLRRIGQVGVPDNLNRDALRLCCPPYISGFCCVNLGDMLYHSAHFDKAPASMGYGWTSSYFARVEEVGDILTFYDGSGSFERWNRQQDGSYVAADPDNYILVTSRETGGWTLTYRDRSRFYFNVEGRPERLLDQNDEALVYDYYTSGLHAGRLERIRDAYGRETVLLYEDDGQLHSTTLRPGDRETLYFYDANRRLESIRNPELEVTGFTYDSDGRLHQVFDAPNMARPESDRVASVAYTYHASGPYKGKVQSVTHYGLSRDEYAYKKTKDGLHTLLTITSYDLTTTPDSPDPVSPPVRTQTVEFDSRFRVVAAVDANGNQSTNLYEDPLNPYLVTQTTTPNGSTLYEYNSDGNLRSTRDAQGNVTAVTYCGEEEVLAPEDPRRHLPAAITRPGVAQPRHDESLDLGAPDAPYPATRLDYDHRGNLVKVTDAQGNEMVLFRRVNAPHPKEIPDPDGTIYWQPGEPQDGRVKAVLDRNGHVTRFSYNSQGNLEVVTTPETPGSDRTRRLVTNFVYDQLVNFDDLVEVHEPFDGRGDATVWRYGYDTLGRLRSLVEPRSFETSFDYVDGQLRFVHAPSNQRARNTGNSGLHLTDPTLGNALPEPRTTEYRYDFASRLERVLSFVRDSVPAQMRVRYTYDGFGNLAQMFRLKDGAEIKKSEYRYDVLDRTRAVLSPARSSTSQGNWAPSNGVSSTVDHDPFCNGFTSTSARGAVNRVDYDNLCRLRQVTNADGTTFYVPDQLGRLVKTVQPGTSEEPSRYGTARRGTDRYGAGGSAAPAEIKTFQYDSLDRLRIMTFPDGTAIRYEYYPGGQVQKVTDVHGKQTEYTYYDDDRLRTVTFEGVHIFEYRYDGRGRLQDIVYPKSTGVRANYTWNTAGLLEKLEYTRLEGSSSTLLHRMEYWYDASGNRTHFFDASQGAVRPTRWEYWYDGLNRLEWVRKDGTPFSYYKFDESDNRIAFERLDVLTEYEYDPGRDELLRTLESGAPRMTFTYDLDGNTTSRTDTRTGDSDAYTINALDRIVGIQLTRSGETESWGHSYDAGNIRRSKKRIGGDGARTDYYYSGLPALSERTTVGVGTNQVSYLVGHQVLGYVADGTLYCFVTDALGSVRSVSTAGGATVATLDYDEYGVASQADRSSSTSTYLGGDSVQFEASIGLFQTLFRAYDAATGRFLSRDPLPRLPLYTYADANPISLSDPLGLAPGDRGRADISDPKGASEFWHKWADKIISATGGGFWQTFNPTAIATRTIGVLIDISGFEAAQDAGSTWGDSRSSVSDKIKTGGALAWTLVGWIFPLRSVSGPQSRCFGYASFRQRIEGGGLPAEFDPGWLNNFKYIRIGWTHYRNQYWFVARFGKLHLPIMPQSLYTNLLNKTFPPNPTPPPVQRP